MEYYWENEEKGRRKKSQGDYKICMPRYNYYHFEFEMAI